MDNLTNSNVIIPLPGMSPESRTHDHKGFTVETVLGGFTIVAHCRKHTFYFAGKKGFDLSTDAKKAKVFRTTAYCHAIIDELVNDHAGWVKTLSKKKVVKDDEYI